MAFAAVLEKVASRCPLLQGAPYRTGAFSTQRAMICSSSITLEVGGPNLRQSSAMVDLPEPETPENRMPFPS